jgi:hypothetical protein
VAAGAKRQGMAWHVIKISQQLTIIGLFSFILFCFPSYGSWLPFSSVNAFHCHHHHRFKIITQKSDLSHSVCADIKK